MLSPRTRLVLTALVSFALLLPSTSQATAAAPPTDWSKAVVDSTMKRFTPAKLGGWGYQTGLYLYGQYLVYKRTGDKAYLDYIRSWVDRFVDGKGGISNSFNNLDSMQSGNLLVLLYQETKDPRYRTAATKIRNRLNSYPRTADGGFWHATSREHQLWLDGTYMVLPFLERYGHAFEDAAYSDAEAGKQLTVYGSHLADSSGLLYHAYDESGTQSWADPKTHHSPEFWCRSIGWYGMASVDVLDYLPSTSPYRAKIVNYVRNLAQAVRTYQDPKTGRWFQVPEKGSLSGNFTETSCSAMFTYMLSKSVQKGYLDPSYQAVADKGYQGVLAKVSLGSDGLTTISDICIGTNVGDTKFYLDRPRATNDFHGLGAFLIMNEQLAKHT
ncbi:glycoside hydrolase family 88/105 protein [Kutzneria albida]|uniref:Glycosyl hydrolase n=1 Tax=Kutzneria albida DSM 43870 TaxID=1449976 RepID=W5WG58_9PSEU|nr:glycoside hydrolase family 88 protein [Kutzneria albida]AHH97129.1 glycosyl hydrolase [Kutzneria albida DSM 43870]